MLRQSATENKAMKAPDTVTGPDGKLHRRADYEDPRNPGHTVPGKLYSTFELQVCGRWGLASPSGHLFSAHLPVEPAPDDLREPRRSEVPENLRQALAEAEAAEEAHRPKMRAAVDAIGAAQDEQQRAARREDLRAYNAALVAERKARERYDTVFEENRALIKRRSDVEGEIEKWLHDERLYRYGLAERPEPTVF